MLVLVQAVSWHAGELHGFDCGLARRGIWKITAEITWGLRGRYTLEGIFICFPEVTVVTSSHTVLVWSAHLRSAKLPWVTWGLRCREGWLSIRLSSSLQPSHAAALAMAGSPGVLPLAIPRLQPLLLHLVRLSGTLHSLSAALLEPQTQRGRAARSKMLASTDFCNWNFSPIILQCLVYAHAFQKHRLVHTRLHSLALLEAQGQSYVLNCCFCISKWTR